MTVCLICGDRNMDTDHLTEHIEAVHPELVDDLVRWPDGDIVLVSDAESINRQGDLKIGPGSMKRRRWLLDVAS